MIASQKRPNKIFQPNSRFKLAVAWILLCTLSSGKAWGEDMSFRDVSVEVTDIDQALDGGSVLIEAQVKNEPYYLLFVTPKSPFAQRFKVPFTIVLWSKDKRFADEKLQPLSDRELTRLAAAMMRSDKVIQNQSVISVLLALNAGMSMNVWGGSAVEALSKGNWSVLFSDSPQSAAVKDDPFD